MLAVVAMVVFILAACKVTIGGVSLLYVGLAFLAAQVAFGPPTWPAWAARRPAE